MNFVEIPVNVTLDKVSQMLLSAKTGDVSVLWGTTQTSTANVKVSYFVMILFLLVIQKHEVISTYTQVKDV